MGDLISTNQSASLKGRHITDGVVVFNEAIDLAKKCGTNCVIFKVDF